MREADEILRELVERATGDARAFASFGALASARQYSLLYRLWLKHVPRGATVLDWGAGSGHFGLFLQKSGFSATAFTLGQPSAMDWIGRPYTSIVLGSPDAPVHLPFGDAMFDAVASIGVLEHVRETGGNERESILEIQRILRPGGTFICYHLPNRWSWIDALAGLVPGKHSHTFRFVASDIAELAAAGGMKIVDVRRYGLLPRNMLRRLPAPLRHSQRFADAWDAADAVLGRAFSVLCQNYVFIARAKDR